MWSGGISLLVVTAFLLSPVTIAAGGLPSSECGSAADLSVHEPINIFGNGDLTADNGVVSGSGTEEDPYILEGWDINATDETGIRIAYTSAHVVIRNVYVHGGSATIPYGGYWMDDNSGILLEAATNLLVEDVRVDHCLYGVFADSGANLRVDGSEFHGCNIGIMAEDTVNATFSDNTVDGCGRGGIRVDGSVETSVEDNDIRDCYAGVTLSDDVGGTTVRGNTLAFNRVGIVCDESGYATIQGNDIACNGVAMTVTDCATMDIKGNLMEENGCGVYILEGYACAVYGNDFAHNDMQAFEFGGGLNTWSDEENETGNYWSDHDGSGPRIITTDVEDPYPAPDEMWQGDRLEHEGEDVQRDWTEAYEGPFYSSAVESGELDGYRPVVEMVEGPGGDLHAAYEVNGILRHSHRAGGVWSLSAFDLNHYITSSIAAMVDDDGDLSLAYLSDFHLEGERPQIMRAVEDDGTYRLFSLRDIDIEPYYSNTCIGTDSWGHTYVAYVSREQVAIEDSLVIFSYSVSCIHNAYGNWTTEVVFDGSEEAPYGLKMALGENGEIHLAYSSRSEDTTTLHYAVGYDGDWSVEEVVDFQEEWALVGVSIDLDSSGVPCVAFSNCSYFIYSYYPDGMPNNTLRYAFKASSGWDIETVATDFRIGEFVDLAVDDDDQPHILYEDQYNSDTMYAERSGENASGWLNMRLDTAGFSGYGGALVADETGAVHVVYPSLQDVSDFGRNAGDIVYVTTEEPASASGDKLDARYLVLACVVAAVLVIAYAFRRRSA